MKGRSVFLFSGIGFPESFSRCLEHLGACIVQHRIFPDHYNYTKNELQEVKKKCGGRADEIVTTEKDFMRNREVIRDMIDPLVLKIKMDILVSKPLLLEVKKQR